MFWSIYTNVFRVSASALPVSEILTFHIFTPKIKAKVTGYNTHSQRCNSIANMIFLYVCFRQATTFVNERKTAHTHTDGEVDKPLALSEIL